MTRKQIQNDRWEHIAALMKSEKLDMVLVFAGVQDFGFGFALSKMKPILYHYLFLDKKSGKLEKGYFVPYFLVGRLGLTGKNNVVTFNDQDVPAEFGKFLKKCRRVGLIGPAPAVHFSQSDCSLIFLDDQVWPLLNRKTADELSGITSVSRDLRAIIKKAGQLVKKGAVLAKISNTLDRAVLKSADALAFPTLVKSLSQGRDMFTLQGEQTKVLREDAIFVNVGAEKGGYFSDCGKMFFPGNRPAEKQYALLDKAFLAFVGGLKAGTYLHYLPAMLSAQIAKTGLKNAKLRERYIGHSIGFNIINMPYIGRQIFMNERLENDSTLSFSVEVKVDGQLFQIQDTVLISAKGNQLLTR